MILQFFAQALLTAFAGIVAAGFAAWVSSYRERMTWVENEIYQPLYNEIHNAALGDMPDRHKSLWDDFNYYKKTRVNDEIRNHLNTYTGKLQELSNVESRDDYEMWYERIADELPAEIFENVDGERKLKASLFESDESIYRDMDEWYKRHLPLFDRWSKTEENLSKYEKEKKLQKISEKAGWNYERLYQCWRDDVNLDAEFYWGCELERAYHSGVMAPKEEGLGYAAYVRKQIQDEAREIETLVTNRIERSLFRNLIKDLRDKF